MTVPTPIVDSESTMLATRPISPSPIDAMDDLSQTNCSTINEIGIQGQAAALPIEMNPEFSHIEKYNIVSVSGKQGIGHMRITFRER